MLHEQDEWMMHHISAAYTSVGVCRLTIFNFVYHPSVWTYNLTVSLINFSIFLTYNYIRLCTQGKQLYQNCILWKIGC